MRHGIAAALVLAAALGAGAWFGAEQPEPPPVVAVVSTPPPGVITVHVAGAVARPGLVRIAAGGRVADAVAAAGGLTADAAAAGVNLAALMRDGDQLIVPATSDAGGPVAGAADDGRVRLNAASTQQLEGLPGVGPVTAARIVAHRDQHGPFQTVEDLLDVPGIGEAKLAALRDLLAVP